MEPLSRAGGERSASAVAEPVVNVQWVVVTSAFFTVIVIKCVRIHELRLLSAPPVTSPDFAGSSTPAVE